MTKATENYKVHYVILNPHFFDANYFNNLCERRYICKNKFCLYSKVFLNLKYLISLFLFFVYETTTKSIKMKFSC